MLSRKESEYVEMCHAAHDLVKNNTYRRLVSEALDLEGRPHECVCRKNVRVDQSKGCLV